MEYNNLKPASRNELFSIKFGDQLNDHHLTNEELHRIAD